MHILKKRLLAAIDGARREADQTFLIQRIQILRLIDQQEADLVRNLT